MSLLELSSNLANLPARIKDAADTASSRFLASVRERIGNAIELPKLASRTPAYEVIVDGVNISNNIKGRLINLGLTDNRGFEADQLDLVLSDADGKLSLPPRGAEVSVKIGWKDSGLVDKGTFTVDEAEHSGAPDVLTIRARSADMRGGLTTQRERSWHQNTVATIVETIAGELGLKPLVAEGLGKQIIEHIDQTNESAANLLTRIASMFDAYATVKAGNLLFGNAGAGLTVSGKVLTGLHITRKSGDQHRFAIADSQTYTHVKATWNRTALGDKGEVVWGKAEDEAERNQPKDPPDDDVDNPRYKMIDKTQVNRGKAYRLARKEWRALSSSDKTKNTYDGVQVPYNDRTLGAAGVVLYGKEDEAEARKRASVRAEKDKQRLEHTAPVVAIDRGGAENIKTLRHVYANQTNATRAARAEWRRLQRGMATFSLTLAEGIPEVFPELPVTVSGFKPDIDGTDWIVSKATHSLNDNGFVTQIEFEMRATEVVTEGD